MILLKKIVMYVFCFSVAFPMFASEKESFFEHNQLHGIITHLKYQRIETDQKVNKLAEVFFKPFQEKVLPKWREKENLFETNIKSYVCETLLSYDTFKVKRDVEFPFWQNKSVKERLTGVVLTFIDDPQQINFKKEIENAQSQLTENWTQTFKEGVNLKKAIASQYVEKYLESRNRFLICGELIEEQLQYIESKMNQNRHTLSRERQFFPIGTNINFDATGMLDALKKSVYAKDSSVLTKEDFINLGKSKNEINEIITSLRKTGYPPEKAEIILKNWNRIQGDKWISNKLLIAKYILGKQIK